MSPDDIYLTSGCGQAIEILLNALARPNANILLPSPGFPYYEAWGGFTQMEMRHFNLLPEKEWEVDLNAVESLADENTVAMVIINPGNPCGNVYSEEHLKKVCVLPLFCYDIDILSHYKYKEVFQFLLGGRNGKEAWNFSYF